jgi:Icc-related predicted phosphoesterase
MSENKTFEELFLSECKEENLSIKEVDILLVSDIHLSFHYLEKLKEWQLENKRLFDYILLTGDILSLKYPDNEKNEIIAQSEAEISSIITFLENMCLNVIYLGGNHDPKSLFDIEPPNLTIRSINLHKKFIKIANDLYFIGLGGSVPTIVSKDALPNAIPYVDATDEILWEGYPYQDNFTKPNYNNSDIIYQKDLQEVWAKLAFHITQNNTTENIKYVLLTHNGPFYSSTTIQVNKGKIAYMGSKTLGDFLNGHENIMLNIHGHTHDGKGNVNYNTYSVINPGSLRNGDFSILKLRRNFANEWIIAKVEMIELNN